MSGKQLNKIKYLTLLSISLLFLISNFAFAEVKAFVKEYTYRASEFDSKISSRAIAFEQVKRLLLEELGTYLEGRTEVTNFQMTKDQITTLTAGIVKIGILEEKWDGETYYLKAEISADPEDVAKSINSLRKDREKSKELEETKIKMDELLKELEGIKKEIRATKTEKPDNRQKDYDKATRSLSAIEYVQRGFSLLLSRNYIEAIECSNKAIELNPKLARAYVNRGDAYNKLGKHRQAIEDYKTAARLGHKRTQDFLRKKGIVW